MLSLIQIIIIIFDLFTSASYADHLSKYMEQTLEEKQVPKRATAGTRCGYHNVLPLLIGWFLEQRAALRVVQTIQKPGRIGLFSVFLVVVMETVGRPPVARRLKVSTSFRCSAGDRICQGMLIYSRCGCLGPACHGGQEGVVQHDTRRPI